MVSLPMQEGGTAKLVSLDGDRGTVESPRASAPGSRFAVMVGGRTLRLKVHRCVREGDTFTISGRFIDLTRDLRDRLVAELAAAARNGELSPDDLSPNDS